MPSREECLRDAARVAVLISEVLHEWPLDAAAERCRRRGESFEAARARVAAVRGA